MPNLVDTNEFIRRVSWLCKKFPNYRLRFTVWDFNVNEIKNELDNRNIKYRLYDIENTLNRYDKYYLLFNCTKSYTKLDELTFESSVINYHVEDPSKLFLSDIIKEHPDNFYNQNYHQLAKLIHDVMINLFGFDNSYTDAYLAPAENEPKYKKRRTMNN